MCQTESVSAYLPTYLYIIISCTPMWNIQKTLARRAISGINMQGTISDCWLLFEWPHLHTKALGACVQQVTYRIPARVPILHIYIYIYIYTYIYKYIVVTNIHERMHVHAPEIRKEVGCINDGDACVETRKLRQLHHCTCC